MSDEPDAQRGLTPGSGVGIGAGVGFGMGIGVAAGTGQWWVLGVFLIVFIGIFAGLGALNQRRR